MTSPYTPLYAQTSPMGTPTDQERRVAFPQGTPANTTRLVLPCPPKQNGPLTRWDLLNQRVREFWAEISGCDGNLLVCLRALFGLSRNREFSANGQVDVNLCSKGG